MGDQTELITSKEVLEIKQTILKNGLFDLHEFANLVAKLVLAKEQHAKQG